MKKFATPLLLIVCLTFAHSVSAQDILPGQISIVPNPANEGQPVTFTVSGLPGDITTVDLVYSLVPDFFIDAAEVSLPLSLSGGDWSVTVAPSVFGNYGFEFMILAQGADTLESDDFALNVKISDFTTITANSAFPNDPEAGLWHSLSLPFSATISLTAVLGNQDISPDNGLPLNWSAYRWDAVADSLVSVSAFNTGVGYFLYHDDQFDIGLEVGGNAVSNQEDAFEEDAIVLHPGWNLIPWPFTFKVEFERDNDNGADLEISQVWRMVNGGWEQATLFQPYASYAIFNKKSSDTVLVSEEGSLLEFKQVFLGKPDGEHSLRDTETNWQIRFIAKSGRQEDAYNFVGVSPVSTTGSDARDEPEPPRIGHGISLSFPSAKGRLSSDIRNSDAPGHVWDMTFEAAEGTKSGELLWEKDRFPAGTASFLVDISNNSIVDLNTVSSYTFSVREQNLFKVVAGDPEYADASLAEIEKLLPERFSVAQNYPNPFNPTTKIRYDLASAGDVHLVVYNMLGQEVATLVSGFHQTGRHETVWDGHDGFGNQVASGVYFYRLAVRNDFGTGFSKTKKMILVR